MRYNPSRPPRLARVILSCMKRYMQEHSVCIELEEEFKVIAEQQGPLRATLWYWGQVVYSIPTYIRMRLGIGGAMLVNYFKMTMKNIKRHKGYHFLNLSGIVVGMTCCLLIFFYIYYEFSFDRYHNNADDIYRVVVKHSFEHRETDMFTTSPGPLAPALKEEFPEVLKTTRVRKSSSVFRYEGNTFYENRLYFVDQEFLDIFTFPLISGDDKTCLSEPFSLVITEEMVKKYFGNEDPLGKSLVTNSSREYKITGIIKNVPSNSHLQFDFLASVLTYKYLGIQHILEIWEDHNFVTYIQLRQNASHLDLERKLPEFIARNRQGDYAPVYKIQPLTDIHFYGKFNDELGVNSDIRYIYIFSAVAFLILLIASFNYINLSTARSENRAREVAIKKVIGASRLTLFLQFMYESIVFCFIAFGLSLIIVKIILPGFSSLINRNLDFSQFFRGELITASFGIIFFVGIVAGIYPALFLSSFKPTRILKGVFKSGSRGSTVFRNSLVTSQFVISVILITSSIIVYNQLQFILNKQLGFDKEHIITFYMRDPRLRNNCETFKSELKKNPAILDVTASGSLPHDIQRATRAKWEGSGENQPLIYYVEVDYGFLDFYKIPLVKGREFSKQYGSDQKEKILVNETAVAMTGWENPIGKKIKSWTIIGVIKDFHFASMYMNIAPLALSLDPRGFLFLSVKVSSSDIPSALAFIEEKWKEFSPNYPFSYSFLDERIERWYQTEKNLSRIFMAFTTIAIVIACLGLFGLASHSVEKRTKEVGIKKVLGATTSNIVFQLGKDLIKWVIIANIIAWPVTYFAMNKWLQNFAYRTPLQTWTFLAGGLMALVIAITTVCYQAVKAATANPIDCLRYE